jgi:hypothetical protein
MRSIRGLKFNKGPVETIQQYEVIILYQSSILGAKKSFTVKNCSVLQPHYWVTSKRTGVRVRDERLHSEPCYYNPSEHLGHEALMGKNSAVCVAPLIHILFGTSTRIQTELEQKTFRVWLLVQDTVGSIHENIPEAHNLMQLSL